MTNGGYGFISIHAPVKGATPQSGHIRHISGHFNPRTREGCDVVPHWLPHGRRNFNPRTREGCDIRFGRGIGVGADISIHAPVKGATRFNCGYCSTVDNFNPRTREGCDLIRSILPFDFFKFQSTHP